MRSDDLEGFGPVGTNSAPAVVDDNDLKPEINNLIWMYAPSQLTLGEAEIRACQILNIIKAAP